MTIDDGLLEDLRKHANETGLDCSSLVEEYVRKGLRSEERRVGKECRL